MAQLYTVSIGLSFSWLKARDKVTLISNNYNLKATRLLHHFMLKVIHATLNLRHFLLMCPDIYIYTWLHATVYWRDNATETPQSDGLTV